MSLRIYGNRRLKTLSGLETRPTLGRVRQALFNIWQGQIQDCRWLDICAGSGSIGAEALCRGAAMVVGIEQSPQACAVIQANWQPLVQPDQVIQVCRGDALKQLDRLAAQASLRPFDRIYCDPPYASGLYQPIVEAIAHHHLLAPGGEIALEHSPQGWQLQLPGGWEIIRQKVYGSAALTFLHIASPRT